MLSTETVTLVVLVSPGHRELAFGKWGQLIYQYLILSLASSHQRKINLETLCENSACHQVI